MVFGLSRAAFTELHVVISLIGIAAGIVFFAALTTGRWLAAVNALFLAFTVLTSVTGFFFPAKPIGPPFIFGVISLLLLAMSLYALYGQRLAGWWRPAFLVTALVAQWLNMVVLVVQSYQKIPALQPLAGGPVFVATQGLVLVAVGYAGWRALSRRI